MTSIFYPDEKETRQQFGLAYYMSVSKNKSTIYPFEDIFIILRGHVRLDEARAADMAESPRTLAGL